MLGFESPLQEIRALLEERDDLVKTIAELQSQLDAVNLSNKASLKARDCCGWPWRVVNGCDGRWWSLWIVAECCRCIHK